MKTRLKTFLLILITITVARGGLASDCAYLGDLNNADRVTCGSLMVPENHETPKGRKIRISYAVVKAANGKAAPDPVIFFSGGPGGGSLDAGFIGFLMNSPLAEKRDIILFDQRGIQHSSALPDIGKGVFEAMAANVDLRGERKLIAKELARVRDIANREGIDLGSYNTIQNARDVGLLMRELGYKKYNLFGVSYGTRLARKIQDLFPKYLKTVTLDSPNLMTDDFLIDRMKSYSSSAAKVIRACKEDSKCRKDHPDLARRYEQVVKKLKRDPIAVEMDGSVFHINPQDAVYFLRRQLYRNNALELFPDFVEALANRKLDVLKAAIENEKGDVTDGAFNTSMFLAVSAYESMDRRNNEKRIDALYRALPYFPARLGFFTNLYLEGIEWHGKTLAGDKRVFELSGIPTIIFVNQYDPVTPPENGPLFQKKLSRSYLFVLDEKGHSGGDFPCKMKVMASLMDNPDRKPVGSCLKIYDPK